MTSLTQLARTALLVGLTVGIASAHGQTLPTGGTSDCAVLTYTNHRLTVTQATPSCVINWESFNIGRSSMVEFLQANSWRVLNRVNGDEFSTIAGTITADGTVYVVNPAGVIFTGSAVVNVGTIYAAASAFSDEDFMAGVDRFTSPTGVIVNYGSIEAGFVHLIGAHVANHGVIRSGAGAITMLAGENEVLIGEQGGRILVRIDGVDLTRDLAVSPGGVLPTTNGPAGVENTGLVEAVGGQIVLGVGDLYSLAVRNSGRIDATGGEAQLAALGGTVVHSGEITAGDVAMTGDVLLLDTGVNADNARFNDPVVVGSDIRIEGEQSGTTATAVRFDATVDSEDGEHNDLEIDADDTRFAADVGIGRRIGHLDVGGRADVGGNVVTAGGVTFGDDTVFTGNGDQTVSGGAGDLIAGGRLTKSVGRSLTLSTGADIEAAGDVAVTTASGNLSMVADRIAVNGSVTTTAGDVRLTGPSAIQGSILGGADVLLQGDAVVGGDVVAGKDARFFGNAVVAGDVTTGEDATFHGTATIGGDVISGEDADFFGAAEVGGHVSAAEDAVFRSVASIGGDVRATRDATFFAGATIGGDVLVGDDAIFTGPAVVGGSVDAVGDATFHDLADVSGDVSAGVDVTFTGDATVGGDVTAGDDVDFLGRAVVGGSVAAGDDVLFIGDASVGGDVVAVMDVDFVSAADVGGDVVAGDDALFMAAATIGGGLSAGDDATFHGPTTIGGDVTAFDDLDIFGASFIGGSVSVGDDALFSGDAVIGGDVTVGDDVCFLGTADIVGNVLAADDVDFFGEATIGGDVGAGDDITFMTRATVAGDVMAVDDVVFHGEIFLGGNVRAGDDVTFDRTVTLIGAGAQTIEAASTLRARETVQKTTAGNLTLIGRERIIFSGPLVQAVGDIHLNPEGRAGVPAVATVIANRDLSIVSHEGYVVMGPREKLTALGHLLISAARGVTLGDLSTVGNLTVDAPEILLRAREGGVVLLSDGGFSPDGGVDYVAGGRFFFSVAPRLLGSGATPIFGSSLVDADALGTLAAFRLRLVSPFPTRLRFDGSVLDLRANGATATSLAEAFADDLATPDRDVSETLVITPRARAVLQELGLSIRSPDATAMASILNGRGVFNDLPAAAPEAVIPLTDRRLHATTVGRFVDRYEALTRDLDGKPAAIRTTLGRAWARYAPEGRTPTGAGFRSSLESTGADPQALAALDQVRDVLAVLQRVGATSRETDAARDRIVESVIPAGMTRAEFDQAIDADEPAASS